MPKAPDRYNFHIFLFNLNSWSREHFTKFQMLFWTFIIITIVGYYAGRIIIKVHVHLFQFEKFTGVWITWSLVILFLKIVMSLFIRVYTYITYIFFLLIRENFLNISCLCNSGTLCDLLLLLKELWKNKENYKNKSWIATCSIG